MLVCLRLEVYVNFFCDNRGMRSRIKRREVRDLIQSNSLKFVAIQETKLHKVSAFIIHSL